MSLIPSVYRGAGGEPEDLVGQTLAGRRLERLLGRGGMGAVYLARRGAEPPVVVKVLAPEVAEEPQVRERFRREWQALQKLPPHPHLVQVLDVVDDARPCIVLEYVEGPTLLRYARQREGGRLPPAEAAELIRQVASGLSVVHAHRLLHRDLNPNNVIRRPDGVAKVVDFGLAKDLLRTTRLTQTGQVMGTAFYMAPEQFEGGPAGPACDVFALGSTLYHLLAGRPPFVGPDLAEVAARITEGDCEPIRDLAPAVPEELERVLLQLLEPELRFRYSAMAEVAEDLARCLRGEPVGAPCLIGASGGRAPLLPGRRFTLGSDPGCELPVPLPGVAPRHAQVRRSRAGYVLCDLKSPSGTFVGEARVGARPHPLRDGDRIRLGQVALTFRDPRQPPG